MSSYYAENLRGFKRRFPALYARHRDLCDGFSPSNIRGLSIRQAKSGALTAQYENLFLHSAYDPLREAGKTIAEDDCANRNAAVFFSAGLGYAVQEFARSYPEKTLALVEPDMHWFLAALWHTDWSAVFAHGNLALLLEAPAETAAQFVENLGDGTYALIRNPNQSAHDKNYFDRIDSILERHRQKDGINGRTQEKFARLWVKNTFRNCVRAAECSGILRYEGAAARTLKSTGKTENLPVCILAAGPSLDEILPYLECIKKRAVLICVDTALRACLNAAAEPHFIVLSDAQYWNYRHLDGLSAPQSILITELAAYPPVFRFPCAEICLFSSLYPPGKFIEGFTEKKGELGAGGSVATTAWDFARLLGATEIFIAGLDLGFPAKKTHFRGSTFEERAHLLSHRLHPAETDSYHALFSAAPFYAEDYNGQPLLTDQRMKLYAWWFENACARFPEQRTKSLTPNGLAIPGLEPAKIETLLDLPEREAELAELCAVSANKKSSKNKTAERRGTENIFKALSAAKSALEQLDADAQKALSLCAEACGQISSDQKQKTDAEDKPHTEQPNEAARQKKLNCLIQELADTDAKLAANPAYSLAALVFPPGSGSDEKNRDQTAESKKKLPRAAEQNAQVNGHDAFTQSAHVYERLRDAVALCEPELEKAITKLRRG